MATKRKTDQPDDGKDQDQDEKRPPQGVGSVELIRRGRELFAELTGTEPESVSGFDRHEGGWRLTLETVELRRIPSSTDVLATYQLDLTEEGEVTGYRRIRRYYRNYADQGPGR